MKVYAKWYGGCSYAASDESEEFASIAEAVGAFRWRYDNVDGYTPCVDESASMTLHATPDDECPIRVVELGPRGGVRVSRC